MISAISLCIVLITSLFGASSCSAEHVPIPPSQDPWYRAPAGFQSAQPGQILKVRPAPGNITTASDSFIAVYNILYRTTDSQYQPSWAVTTLFVPTTPVSGETGATALLSFQVAYDSAAVDYCPSYDMARTGAVTTEVLSALAAGWYVSVPDYEGPKASFTAGVQSGHATIDAVRAALNSGFGLASAPEVRYAMWGYSGGSLASEWAAELAIQYAPEMNFSGAALGGLTPDVLNVLNTCTGTICADLLPPGILGLASQFPEVYQFVISQLKTEGKQNATAFMSVTNATTWKRGSFAFQDVYGYFVNGNQIVKEPLVKKVLNSDGRMGYHGVPTMPLFVYKAVRDEVSPVADTDALIFEYCTLGASIEYERNLVGGHSAEQYNGGGNAFKFLQKVLTGSYTPPSGGCLVTNTSYNASVSEFKRRDYMPVYLE